MGTTYLTDGDDLTSVANAIRAKSGGSSQLVFPAGFVSEIGNIPSGGGGLSLLASGTITTTEEYAFFNIPVSYSGTPKMFLVYAPTPVSGQTQTCYWVWIDSDVDFIPQSVESIFPTIVEVGLVTNTGGRQRYSQPATITASQISVQRVSSAANVRANTYEWYIWGTTA